MNLFLQWMLHAFRRCEELSESIKKKKKKNLLEFFAHVYFGFMSNNHGKTNITGASKYFKF